mgnify:CR=1 FL=1
MNPLGIRVKIVLVLVALLLFNYLGLAQVEAPASPEPGDSPIMEKAEVPNISPAPELDAQASSSTPEEPPAGSVAPSAFGEKRLEQRVDGTGTQEVIRVAPRSKKNVTRLDNRPNRPKAKLVAVIKGPVSPWGYGTRYLNGEVARNSAKDLKGTNQRPGQQAGAAQTGVPTGGIARGGGLGGKR